MGRTEAVEYRGFRVIKVWEFQNDLAARWLFVPSVHMSSFHAAGIHKIGLPQEIWPRKVRKRFCVNCELAREMQLQGSPHS
jgi:hypothetical protein